MKKQMIAYFCIVVLAAVLMGGCTAMSENSKNEYYTADELKALFFENQELFEEVAQMMLDNHSRQYPSSQYIKIDVDENTVGNDYFTQTEWERIRVFLAEISPAYIECSGGIQSQLVEVGFFHINGGELYLLFSLDEAHIIYDKTSYYDTVELLGGNWYIREVFPKPE